MSFPLLFSWKGTISSLFLSVDVRCTGAMRALGREEQDFQFVAHLKRDKSPYVMERQTLDADEGQVVAHRDNASLKQIQTL